MNNNLSKRAAYANIYFSVSNPAFVFLFMYLLMYVFTVVPTVAPVVDKMRNHITVYGIMFHFISALAFLVGCHAAAYSYHCYGIKKRFRLVHPRLFGTLIYLCCSVSIGVVLWQISLSVTLTSYLRELAAHTRVEHDIRTIQHYFLRPREAGGLPGIIKMFSYLPLSALYMVLARESIRNRFDDTKGILISSGAKRYIFVILITILVRSLFTLDRALIGSVFVITIYYFVFNIRRYGKIKGHSKKRLFFLFAILVSTAVFLHIISTIRQGISFKDVLAQYSSLGLSNLSIMLESDFDYTLGLNICNVIKFPLEYFGLSHILPNFKEAEWVWSPAKYLTAYAYNDFGLSSILFFIGFGFVTTIVYLKAGYKCNPYTLILLFALTIGIVTSIVVPLFRGPDWWASLLMALVGMKLTYRKTQVTNSLKVTANNG